MPADKPATEPAADTSGSHTDGPDTNSSHANSPDTNSPDTKDKFRAALERKRAQHHANNAEAHSDSKVHSEHSRAGGKRTFRRKSG